LNRKVNLLASSVHFGCEPNRKRVCGSLNRTRQNHYGSEPNQTEPGTVEITPLNSFRSPFSWIVDSDMVRLDVILFLP